MLFLENYLQSYRLCSRSGELFTWRAAKTRLFNNVAILLRTEDEADEYIQAIGEQIKVTMALAGYVVSFSYVPVLKKPKRLDRNKYGIFQFTIIDISSYLVYFYGYCRRRMMNMVASVFRSRGDCSTRPQFQHTTFSKLDSGIGDGTTSSVEVHMYCIKQCFFAT